MKRPGRTMAGLPQRAKWTMGAAFAGFILNTAPAAAAQASCTNLLDALESAVVGRGLEAARDAEYALGQSEDCRSEDGKARDALQSLELDLVSDARTSDALRKEALDDIMANGQSWQNAVTLADRLFAAHDLPEAVSLYDRAIALAGQHVDALSETEREALLAKASAAKMLASNDDEGRKPAPFVRSMRGPQGQLGGIYSLSLRGLAPRTVPLPVSFASGTAILTPGGEKAAAELADALVQQKPARITLVGHTDPRGPDDYNRHLSEQRARRLADYLTLQLGQHHITVAIQIVGKGKSDPYDVTHLPYVPSQDEVWALDRRVDFIR